MREGTKIGAYTLRKKLGEGGSAEVWLAEHGGLGVRRALKFSIRSTETAIRRTRNEARIQASVTHPNVVTVHDVFDHDGLPVIVQDFVEGMELGDAGAFGLTPSRLEGILWEVLEGLAALHGAGILHRDIKPSNIIVTQGGRVCLLDLGIARSDDIEGGTWQGCLMGTPSYMAPEQADDATAATIASDLFSVGCVALTMLTGEEHFYREGVRQTLNAVASCDASVQEALKDVKRIGATGRIATLIERCVQADPSARPRNAKAVQALLLNPSSQGLTHTLDRAPVAQRLRGQRQRANPTLVATLGAISGAGFGATALAGVALVAALLGSVESSAVATSMHAAVPLETSLRVARVEGPLLHPERQVVKARSLPSTTTTAEPDESRRRPFGFLRRANR